MVEERKCSVVCSESFTVYNTTTQQLTYQCRHALGLADGSPSHPLADLLRTVPRLRQLLEGPPDEDAVLDLRVLKGAHAQLRPARCA